MDSQTDKVRYKSRYSVIVTRKIFNKKSPETFLCVHMMYFYTFTYFAVYPTDQRTKDLYNRFS